MQSELDVREFRMNVMPIAEILNEIDACLSRLRQARELLLDQQMKAPPKKVTHVKRKVIPRRPDPASSRTRRAYKNKSRSNHPMAHLKKETERIEISAQIPSAITHPATRLEQPAIAPPEPTIPQSVVTTRIPSKGFRTSISSVRLRTSKSNPGTKPDAAKPAIALAGAAGAKIVVVPAEQVRREREQATRPEVRRSRVPASGLTGRLAFEALFK
jgi:hypothetical protein